jgi:hypothetical protein
MNINVIIHIYSQKSYNAENYKIVIKTILSLLFFFVVRPCDWRAVSVFYFCPFIPTINTHYRKVPVNHHIPR